MIKSLDYHFLVWYYMYMYKAFSHECRKYTPGIAGARMSVSRYVSDFVADFHAEQHRTLVNIPCYTCAAGTTVFFDLEIVGHRQLSHIPCMLFILVILLQCSLKFAT